MSAARSGLAALLLIGCSTPAQQAAPTHPTVISRSETMSPPALPFACDLETVPVGSWAEYEARDPLRRDATTIRVALVKRAPEGNTIEWTNDAAFPAVVIALVLAPDKGPPRQLLKRVMQDGELDPMEIQTSAQHGLFWQLDPRTRVGSEEIAVRVGSFHATRYHYQTPVGENVDAWIGDTAGPICLLKLDAEQKRMPSSPGRFSYELVATGSDAKPRITRPPVPYDIEVLKRRDDQRRARDRRQEARHASATRLRRDRPNVIPR